VHISKEIKVGILITVALAGLLWGLNYLKGKDIFSSRNNYYAIYNNVDGLVASNAVLMNGYKIGIVSHIDFMKDHSGRLLVTLLLNNKVYIAKNSVARIFNMDLIGSKALRIDMGNSAEMLKDGDTLKTDLEKSLAQQLGQQVVPLRDKAENLIVSIDSVVGQLHRLLMDTITSNHIKDGIEHINHSLASIDNLVGSEQGKFYKMIANLESITSTLKANDEKISSILNNIDQVSDTLAAIQFAKVINHADEVLIQTNTLLEKINKGEGSLGKLANDEQLYNHLDSTAKDLDDLFKDLKANPKRYVHFSVFGKKDK
jgi:phospholipid/cholesterol/gamma-HCH transport system substrate-binding protein